MTKLRSDSVWRGLSAEQRAKLETWLFENNLSYLEILDRVRGEFGLKTSLTSLKMFCRRLFVEREELQRRMEVLKSIGFKNLDDERVKKMRLAAEGLAFTRMVEISSMPPGKADEMATLCRVMTANRRIDLELAKTRLIAKNDEPKAVQNEKLSACEPHIVTKVSLSQPKSG